MAGLSWTAERPVGCLGKVPPMVGLGSDPCRGSGERVLTMKTDLTSNHLSMPGSL